MKINLIKYNTFILCIYLNSFIFFVISKKIGISSELLVIFLLPIYLLPFVLKGLSSDMGKKRLNSKKILIFLYFMIVFLNLFAYLNNNYFLVNLKYIILYSGIAIYFSTLKISLNLLKKHLKFFLIVHLITLLYILIDKSLYEKMQLDYMFFGYDCLFVTICFAYFYKETLKFRYLLLLSLGNILLLIYGSRFTFLLGVLASIIFLYSSKRKWVKRLITISVIALPIIYFNLKLIFSILIGLFNRYNIPTESLRRLVGSLNIVNSGNSLFYDRLIWYSETLNIIKENPIFGVGTFGYEGKISYMLYNGDGTFYPHNIFLEILLHFGIVGFLAFLIIIVLIIRKIHYSKKNVKRLDSIELIFFIMSLGLLVSGSYLRSTWFYFTLLIPFNKSYYYYVNKKNNYKLIRSKNHGGN